MKTKQDYLNMQIAWYENEATKWSLENKRPVVGSYHQHNKWKDYDLYLFPDIDTSEMIALEFGCGPARNMIRFHSKFKRIDGVDIGRLNIQNAILNLKEAGIEIPKLYVNDGDNIPTPSHDYDLVFSVICLQHIASFDVRDDIIKEVYRVLKEGGFFCFQMGYGGPRPGLVRPWAKYHENAFDALVTNGGYDVSVTDLDELTNHLKTIGFKDITTRLRPTGPGCGHSQWLWVQCRKG